MDNLFKQTRLRFSGANQENKEEPGSSKERRIPPQKTQSFKDKKKESNWFRKQVSWKMSQDHDSSNGDEHVIAVAAAAYVISSLEPEVSDLKQRKEDPKTSIVPIKSKKEDPTISIPDHGRASKKYSGEITQISDTESKAPVTSAIDAKIPDKVLRPSLKNTTASLDKQLSGSASFKPSGEKLNNELPTSTVKRTPSTGNKEPSDSFKRVSSTLKPESSTPNQLVPQLSAKRQNSTRAGRGKSQADIWEETELARITERYEMQKSSILSWEGKKKTKAKRRLEKAERELERKKVKAIAKYKRAIQNIDQVVGGAKAKAEEKKKNDELKVKEKANIIRKTGKVPNACSCF